MVGDLVVNVLLVHPVLDVIVQLAFFTALKALPIVLPVFTAFPVFIEVVGVLNFQVRMGLTFCLATGAATGLLNFHVKSQGLNAIVYIYR